MNFFDKANKAAGELKCYTGFHTTKWRYISPDSCKQELHCTRCGFKERIKHQSFSRWIYEREGRCIQSRNCARCTYEDFRIKHFFDHKVAISPLNCKHFSKTCGRCSHEEEEHNVMPQHDWSHWIENSRRRRQVYKYCRQCGKREFKDFH